MSEERDEREFGPRGDLEMKIGEPPITLVPRSKKVRKVEKLVGGNLIEWLQSCDGGSMPSVSLTIEVVNLLKEQEDERNEDDIGDVVMLGGMEEAVQDVLYVLSRVAGGSKGVKTVADLTDRLEKEVRKQQERVAERIVETIKLIQEKAGDDLPSEVSELLQRMLPEAAKPEAAKPEGDEEGKAEGE